VVEISRPAVSGVARRGTANKAMTEERMVRSKRKAIIERLIQAL